MTDDHHPAPRFLLPGFSQTSEAWGAVVNTLPDRVNATPLDIPPNDDFASTARSLVDTRRGVWAGYSLGGRLALHIAINYPSRVTGLLLVSASPGIAAAEERFQRRRRDVELAAWAEKHTIDEFLNRWLSQPMFGLDRERTHRLDSTQAVAGQLRKLGQGVQPPLWDRLHEVETPVIVLAGGIDTKYAGIAHEMAAAIGGNAEVHIAPDAGHALLEERPEFVGEFLLRL